MRKLIYIMGCAHCGSTLLTTLLGRHSRISTVGELKMTAIPDDPDYLCGCGDRLSECSFWRDVREIFRKRGEDLPFPHLGTHYSEGEGLSRKMVGTMIRGKSLERVRKMGLAIWPPARRTLSDVTRRNVEVVDAICEVEQKPVLLDGSKDPTRLLHLMQSGQFDVRGIYLVRDGRAILASYKKRNPDVPYCLNLWKTKATECENLMNLMGSSKIMTLRYEDFCRDVHGSISDILEFCGVQDTGTSFLDHPENPSTHIIGHASRLNKIGEITSREQWRNDLTPDDLDQFWNHEGGLNSRHGYAKPIALAAQNPTDGNGREREQPISH